MARLDACLECGDPFERASGREFCAPKCRKDWNNRRMKRGAELYDLYMAHRFDRSTALELRVFQAINRMASNFRLEDRAERAGRQSWRRPGAVLEERPYLRSVTTRVRMGRMSG